MELTQALARRRMVRRYDPDAPVSPEALDAVVGAALRAPSAGFTQGVSLVVLGAAADRERFWSLTASETESNRWLDGMRTAPVLVLVLADREAYLDRYAMPDKGWTDRDAGRWTAPYWYVDAGMAAMAMLLSAVDQGLGACFFGVPTDRLDAVREGFGVPADQLVVGVVSLGHPPADGDPGSRGSALRRRRKARDEVVHRGRW